VEFDIGLDPAQVVLLSAAVRMGVVHGERFAQPGDIRLEVAASDPVGQRRRFRCAPEPQTGEKRNGEKENPKGKECIAGVGEKAVQYYRKTVELVDGNGRQEKDDERGRQPQPGEQLFLHVGRRLFSGWNMVTEQARETHLFLSIQGKLSDCLRQKD